MSRFVIYTTIYTGMERFVEEWCRSIICQDYRDFDVWVGVDNVEAGTISSFLDDNFGITFIHALAGDTPVSLRCRAMKLMVAKYEAIVFTDSDDVLEPHRVSAALSGLTNADLYGCSLGIIDVASNDLGIYFGLIEGEQPEKILPRNNFLGLSNTAWRSETLEKCLPAPEHCVALDWLLVTRAWGKGAKITFDRTARMRYRQYGTNIACVVPPFSAEQIIRATDVVTDHYKMVTDDPGIPTPQRQILREAAARIAKFRYTILSLNVVLDKYVTELNKLPPHRLWWMSVAHPALEDIWNS